MLDCLQVQPEEFFAENYKNYSIDKALYEEIKRLPQASKESLLSFIKGKWFRQIL